ncbi:MAG: hypothetical protein ACP5T0_04250 [Verrucomicrobiia bacterium]
MRKILHLLTEENDCLASQIIDFQKKMVNSGECKDAEIEIIHLAKIENYEPVIEKIFEADSIQVW